MLNAHILTPLLPLAALAVILTGCRADESKTRPISKSITTAPVPDDITPAPAEIDAEAEKAKQAAQKAKKQAAEKAAQKAKKQAAEKAALLAAEKAAQKAAETAAFQSACRDKITAKMPDPSAAKISYTQICQNRLDPFRHIRIFRDTDDRNIHEADMSTDFDTRLLKMGDERIKAFVFWDNMEIAFRRVPHHLPQIICDVKIQRIIPALRRVNIFGTFRSKLMHDVYDFYIEFCLLRAQKQPYLKWLVPEYG